MWQLSICLTFAVVWVFLLACLFVLEGSVAIFFDLQRGKHQMRVKRRKGDFRVNLFSHPRHTVTEISTPRGHNCSIEVTLW